MRKIAILVSIFVYCLVLTGCFDIYQNITLDKDGKTIVYTQITASKALIAMANYGNEDTDGIDYDEWFEDNVPDDISDIPDVITLETDRINTSTDVGMFYKLKVDYAKTSLRDLDTEEGIYYFPFINDGKILIKTNFDGSKMTDESNAMAMGIISSAKYRIIVSKRICENIKHVILECNNDESFITPMDIGDGFLIEIPIIQLMADNTDIYIY